MPINMGISTWMVDITCTFNCPWSVRVLGKMLPTGQSIDSSFSEAEGHRVQTYTLIIQLMVQTETDTCRRYMLPIAYGIIMDGQCIGEYVVM